MDALREHTERVNKQDHNVFLGRLVWYTVSDAMVSHSFVVSELVNEGLSSQLPPAPKDFDIFRRVSSQMKRTKVLGASGLNENYLIREVAGRGEDVITKRIVCEVVDRENKKLSYNADLVDVEFNRNTCSIKVAPLQFSGAGNPDLDHQINVAVSIGQDIQQEFQNQRGKLNSYAIREFVRRMLLSKFDAILVREGGGVYFVQEDNAVEVEALERFVNKIPGAVFHSLPLIDDRKQREMIRNAFESESVGAIDELMAEIKEIVSEGTKISQDRYTKIVTQYQDLTAKAKSYGDMLDTAMGETNSRLSLFQTSITQLLTQVRSS